MTLNTASEQLKQVSAVVRACRNSLSKANASPRRAVEANHPRLEVIGTGAFGIVRLCRHKAGCRFEVPNDGVRRNFQKMHKRNLHFIQIAK